MHIADSFFEDSRTWFRLLDFDQRPLGGIHFASRFLPESSGKEAVEFLPPTLTSKLNNATDCLGMFLFDVWAMHADKRQALFYADQNLVHATFIDQGHLFGGPGWRGQSFQVNGRWLQKVAVEQYEDQRARDEWISRLRDTLPVAFNTAIADYQTLGLSAISGPEKGFYRSAPGVGIDCSGDGPVCPLKSRGFACE